MPNSPVSDPNQLVSSGNTPIGLPTPSNDQALPAGEMKKSLPADDALKLGSTASVVNTSTTPLPKSQPASLDTQINSSALPKSQPVVSIPTPSAGVAANAQPTTPSPVISMPAATIPTNSSVVDALPITTPQQSQPNGSTIPVRSFSKPSPVTTTAKPVGSPLPSVAAMPPGVGASLPPQNSEIGSSNTQPAGSPAPNIAPISMPSAPATPPPSTTPSGSPSPSVEGAGQPPKKVIDSGKPDLVPPAQPPKSRKFLRLLPVVVVILLLVAVLGVGANFLLNRQSAGDIEPGTTPQTNTPTQTLTYWGLWEPGGVVEEVLSDFETQNPGVQVDYVQQSPKQYRDRLQTAIVSGSGPDVFRYHASWVPMMRSDLSPLPEKIMPAQEFQETFYPIMSSTLTYNGEIVGMPLMYEGLGLYYNKEIFRVANLTPPENWEEVKQQATDLTIRSGNTITRAGIALGTAANVEHFSDIIGLMMLQNGANPGDPTTPEAQEALSFYMEFANALQVWDNTMPTSTTAFARGDVAMMIAPSWRAHEIKAINPNLDFDIVPVPQLVGADKVSWASFWAEGVNAQSRRKELAWELLAYLSSAEVQQKFYQAAQQERAFGPIYSRVDLASQLQDQPYVGAYIQDAPVAQSWYMNSYTHDEGLNDKIIEFYKQAIDSNQTNGASVKQGIDQVLQQYGLVNAPVQ